MKNLQIMFFSLKEDMEPIIKNIEKLFEVQYYKSGLFDSNKVSAYPSVFSIQDFGFTAFGNWINSDSFLILPKTVTLNVRDVSQRKGGVMYAIDQMTNPQSVELNLGGIYLEKPNVLVAGWIATISGDSFSIDLFKAFSSSIKKEFVKKNDFFVGKEAKNKLQSGWRLVLDVRRSGEYDLKM